MSTMPNFDALQALGTLVEGFNQLNQNSRKIFTYPGLVSDAGYGDIISMSSSLNVLTAEIIKKLIGFSITYLPMQITQIVVTNTTATATTLYPHSYVDGDLVTITGSKVSNGLNLSNVKISVYNNLSFNYSVVAGTASDTISPIMVVQYVSG